ncbi:MAG: NUDIX hydrolase [Bacteroidota bacterium]
MGQKNFNNLLKSHYFVNPAAAVAAIITDSNNHILFTKRAQEPFKNTWDLPGGFVDPNETAEEAVDREVKEELSIHIQSKSYYRSYWNHYFYGGVTYYTLDMAFLCQVNNFQNLKTSDEIRAYQFVPKNKVDLNKIGLPSIRRTVADYLLSNH